MTSDLLNESVFRTNRARRWRSVLLKRSRLYWGNVAGLAAALAAGDMLALRHHFLVSLPEVRERQRMTQSARDTPPEQAAGLLAPVADGAFQVCQCSKRRSGASCGTRPARPIACSIILFLRRATKDQSSSSSSTSSSWAGASVLVSGGNWLAFFNHSLRVLRPMPKRRQTPRLEARSW